jgi:DNA-binding NarL/FixJ family response regulator
VTIRVALVDDQALLRAGFRMVLEAQDDIEVVAEAENGRAAIELIQRLPVDVVLMDIRMPVLDGIAATRAITTELPNPPRVLILTTFDLDEYAYNGLQAGASGFLLKDAPPEQLLHAIRVVAQGDAILAPTLTRRLIDRYADRLAPLAPDAAAVAQLTEREREVLLEIALGQSNSEIAQRLHLSEATIKSHVGHILTKLELRDRVQAVVYAYESGLVSPDRPER